MFQAQLRGGLGFSIALALAVAAGGCDGGSTGEGGAGGTGGETSMGGSGGAGGAMGGAGGMSGIPGKTIQGTVDYAGMETGTLIVGVYDTCPPMGPPVQLKVQTFDTPMFPQDFSLTGINAGSYYIAAVLDIGNNNPTQPGPEDLLACSAQVTITDSAGAETTVMLEDK